MQTCNFEDNNKELTFSIIVPVWPGDERPFGLDYVDKLDWPSDRLEVILARGYGPCRQRNAAAKVAKGSVLVFFDDDPQDFAIVFLEALHVDLQPLQADSDDFFVDRSVSEYLREVTHSAKQTVRYSRCAP